MLCSTTRNVMPRALSSRITSVSRPSRLGLTPPAGSSSRISFGSSISTWASSTSFCCPYERSPARCPANRPQADDVEQLPGPVGLVAADRVGEHRPPVPVRQRRDDVLQHGHLLEQPGGLERAAEAEVAALPRRQSGRSAGRRTRSRPASACIVAGDEVEQRGLAGPVRPDQRGDRALPHGQVGAVDGDQAAEPLAGARRPRAAARRRRARPPTRPRSSAAPGRG